MLGIPLEDALARLADGDLVHAIYHPPQSDEPNVNFMGQRQGWARSQLLERMERTTIYRADGPHADYGLRMRLGGGWLYLKTKPAPLPGSE